MSEPADLNVDELRRRARRRLVGAIVLALAAAVVVPMLLESEPRPLGEDVSVKIPPVDDGKFVNRLSDTSKSNPRAPDGSKSTSNADKAGTAGNAGSATAPSSTAKDSSRPAAAPGPATTGEVKDSGAAAAPANSEE
jgi:DedD protein